MTPDNLREMLASAALHASIPDGPALAVLIASTNWFRIRHENPDDIDGARMLFSAVGLAAADAVLAALRNAGLAIVPKEPNGVMVLAGWDSIDKTAFRRAFYNTAIPRSFMEPILDAALSAGDLLGERA